MAVDVPEGITGLPGAEGCPDDVDLVTLFAQVDPRRPSVDLSGNCGNLSAAASAYALSRGLVRGVGERCSVRVWNMNTRSVYELEHELSGGILPRSGDFSMPGVLADGPRIDMRFEAPGGEQTGAALPCGPVSFLPEAGLEASLVDITNPLVLVRAEDVGLPAGATPEELNARTEVLDRLEVLRKEAGRRMGLPASAAIPKVSCLNHAEGSHEVGVRTTSLGVFHHAIPVTAAVAIGGASALGGTLLDEFAVPTSDGDLLISQPKGTVTTTARASQGRVQSAGIARTARIIADAVVHPA